MNTPVVTEAKLRYRLLAWVVGSCMALAVAGELSGYTFLNDAVLSVVNGLFVLIKP